MLGATPTVGKDLVWDCRLHLPETNPSRSLRHMMNKEGLRILTVHFFSQSEPWISARLIMGLSQVVILFAAACPLTTRAATPRPNSHVWADVKFVPSFGTPPHREIPQKGCRLSIWWHTSAANPAPAMSGLGVGEGGRRAARGGREATDEGEGADDHHLSQTTTHIRSLPSNE